MGGCLRGVLLLSFPRCGTHLFREVVGPYLCWDDLFFNPEFNVVHDVKWWPDVLDEFGGVVGGVVWVGIVWWIWRGRVVLCLGIWGWGILCFGFLLCVVLMFFLCVMLL